MDVRTGAVVAAGLGLAVAGVGLGTLAGHHGLERLYSPLQMSADSANPVGLVVNGSVLGSIAGAAAIGALAQHLHVESPWAGASLLVAAAGLGAGGWIAAHVAAHVSTR